jgi:hypothetical protein
MEILATLISIVLLIGLIVSPILIQSRLNKSNQKYKLVIYVFTATIFTSLPMLLFSWWSDKSNEILLSHYGYDFDAMNGAERFAKVASENIERVKKLEISMMGIGWPLKAIISYLFYFPYLLIIYFIFNVANKNKMNEI